MKNQDKPAMPTIYADMGHNGQREVFCDETGLTKREEIIARFMSSMLSNPAMSYKPDDLAEDATRYADAYFKAIEVGND